MQEFSKLQGREKDNRIKQLIRNEDSLVVPILKGTYGDDAKNTAIYYISVLFDKVEERYKFLEEIDKLNMFNSRDWFFLGVVLFSGK